MVRWGSMRDLRSRAGCGTFSLRKIIGASINSNYSGTGVFDMESEVSGGFCLVVVDVRLSS